MHVLRMFAFRSCGEAEDAIGICILVCQAALNQPVEHTIERYPIKRRFAKCLLDLGVAQGSWG